MYKPPLTSESDTQFFSKEFTKVEILNPEEVSFANDDDGAECAAQESTDDSSPDSLWEGELECLYSAKGADDAEHGCEFDQFCQGFQWMSGCVYSVKVW